MLFRSCLAALLVCAMLGQDARSCTILKFVFDGHTYFCNNEDWRDPIHEIRFFPAEGEHYGWVYFGMQNNWAQGGVNEHGLCFDWVAGGGTRGWKSDSNKKDYSGNLSEELLRTCRDVDEAIEFYQTYNERYLDGGVTLVADAKGNSVLVQWKNGKLILEKNTDAFQSCGVGKSAVDSRLANLGSGEAGFSIAKLAKAMASGKSEGEFATKYTNIISPSEGKLYVFAEGDISKFVEVDYLKKLWQGDSATLRIDQLFDTQTARERSSGGEDQNEEENAAEVADLYAVSSVKPLESLSHPKLFWYQNLDEASARAKESAKPILLEINGRPWCPPCNAQFRNIISKPEFLAWSVENVVLLDIQVGKGYQANRGNPVWRDVFKKHGLQGIPYFVFLSPEGEQLGSLGPETNISAWIEKANGILGVNATLGD